MRTDEALDERPDGGGSGPAGRVPGKRVVLTVYAIVVAIAAILGALLGLVNPVGLDPTLPFVDLPATPLGMVTFGVVAVGGGLGVLLLLVRLVSRIDGDAVE